MSSPLSRRDFLRQCGASALCAFGLHDAFLIKFLSRKAEWDFILAPEQHLRGEHSDFGVGILDLRAQRSFSVPTAFSGHSVIGNVAHPQRAIMFAQRPGILACELDILEHKLLRVFRSGKDRHFYGHGCYSADGKLLFSTENTFENGSGVLVVRDAATFKILGEFPSYGAGPHDIKLISQGRTLLVANSGVHWDAKTGAPFGIEEMKPSLTYVDVSSGKLLHQDFLEPQLQHAGVEHLAASDENDVAVGLTLYGESSGPIPSLCLRHRGGELTVMREPKKIIRRMNSSSFSLALHQPTLCVGVVNPMGNMLTFWGIPEKKFLKMFELQSPEGIAVTPDNKHFVVTTRNQGIRFFETRTLEEDKTSFPQLRGLNWRHANSWSC